MATRKDVQRLRDQAAKLLAEIERLQGLPDDESSEHNVEVTQAQKDRRGAGVAKARAKGPIATAIANSKWRSVSRYAKARAHVSQPALSRYITGSLECPPEVADRVHEDFPHLTDSDWPKPPRRH
jgi:hypothetical protein